MGKYCASNVHHKAFIIIYIYIYTYIYIHYIYNIYIHIYIHIYVNMFPPWEMLRGLLCRPAKTDFAE